MPLLEVNSYNRPQSLTTIYRHNIDLLNLTEQIKGIDTELENRINSGEITFEVREPTQTLVAALILNVNAFEKRVDKAFGNFSKLIKGMDKNLRDAELSFATRQIAINIEEHTPSAYKQQISYVVADLPA